MTSLTVVIPSFNEGDNVAALLDRLEVAVRGIDTEVLYMDDSTDDTPSVIVRESRGRDMAVRCVHRAAPTGGLAGAVIEGLLHASAPIVVVCDADLQHPPETVADLYRTAVRTGVDVVVASRYMRGGTAAGLDGGLRRLVSTWSGRVAKALFPRRLSGCSDPMSGFFAVRRDAVDFSVVAQSGYKVLLALLLHAKLVTAELPFTFAQRHAGESKANFKEGIRYLRLLCLLRTGPGLLFTLVGASGVLPNLAVVYLLTAMGMHYLLASAIAVQVAIGWNFAGAELIMFRDRRFGKLWHRAIRYQLLSESDLLRLPFVALLVDGVGLDSVLATALTLLLAVALRYSLAARHVYAAPVTEIVLPDVPGSPAPVPLLTVDG